MLHFFKLTNFNVLNQDLNERIRYIVIIEHGKTEHDKIELYRCYSIAKMKRLPDREGTYTIWRKINPTVRLEIKSNQLNKMRYYYFCRNNCLTKCEKKKIT